MGWQGNRITWSFVLPADARRISELRFELVVRESFRPIRISVAAGPGRDPTEDELAPCVETW